MCPLYIADLIGPGDRKRMRSMAARAGEAGYDQLHHFVAASVWDSVLLKAALPRKEGHSVGVAPQYTSSLGTNANCQTLVSVTLASREVSVMVDLRQFLPESWAGDPERMRGPRCPSRSRSF